MAIKFSKIEPGMTLLDVKRTKIGNTTMSEWSCWNVKIISVDRDAQTAVAIWNDVNRPSTWTRRQLERLHRSLPKAVRVQEERRSARGGRW